MMILGGLNAAQGLLFVLVGIMGMFDPTIFNNGADFGGGAQDPMVTAITSVGMAVLMLGSGGFIFLGGWNFYNMKSHGLAMAGAIMAVIPCLTIYCCVPGIAIGIWALIVLNKPEVKAAFR
jgi:hypothetical protein